MSFSVILQTSSSEKNALDKTLTTIATVTGTLKEKTSIIDPVILIEGDLSSFVNANYCTIATFGRSYFITNISSVRNGLFEISCHVDVLSSFKTEIRTNSAVIKKSEGNWNLYLNDGSLQAQQDVDVTTHKFTAGTQFNANWSYVLLISG